MSPGAQFVARGFDAQGTALRLEAETAGEAVLEEIEVLVLEFHYFAAIRADEVIVARVVHEVRIVAGLLQTEIDFPQQSAFDEETEGTVEGGPAGGRVEAARPFPEFIGREMVRGGEAASMMRSRWRVRRSPLPDRTSSRRRMMSGLISARTIGGEFI